MASPTGHPASPIDRATARAAWLGPLACIAAILGAAPLLAGERAWELLGWLAAYSTPVAGKEVVIPAMVARGFQPMLVVPYLAALDAAVCALLLLNLDKLHRVPRVGPWVERLLDRVARAASRSRLLRRGAFAGLLLHAAVPHKGGGGVGSGLLGHTLGLRRSRVVAAVALGGLISGFVVAQLAQVVLLALGWG